ncbi:hypothetical protein NKR19_g8058 [Coniochaeta hoffmannii]|uniref:Chromo domain-containing protein n=1 Tax=Coniochaeta hoffmannii TaxID=91930 RepID=A0AA38RPF5_9PEZI|nr:hypothetical protein NKR19_g8058 [Coniochaeta hoffmannii]
MMKICMSILEDDAPSSEAGPAPSLITTTGAVSQATDDAEQSDAEDDGSIASDESERKAERYKRAGSRKTAQQTGQRRRWSRLEEKRLEVYMNDPEVEKMATKARKSKEAWIAARLDRSESAVKQHWEIMKGSSPGRVVPSTKQTRGHRSARDRGARLTKVMNEKIRQGSSFYDAGEEEWEVEEIKKHRTLDDSLLEYLVKWKTGEETWEPLGNVAETVALESDRTARAAAQNQAICTRHQARSAQMGVYAVTHDVQSTPAAARDVIEGWASATGVLGISYSQSMNLCRNKSQLASVS